MILYNGRPNLSPGRYLFFTGARSSMALVFGMYETEKASVIDHT